MQNNGSTWRKWDLHIHTPSTKLNNQYKDTDENLGNFIDILEKSDVEKLFTYPPPNLLDSTWFLEQISIIFFLYFFEK